MIAAVDVHYFGEVAQAALVAFADWTSDEALLEGIQRVDRVAPYVPGEFFRRELPCVLPLIEAVKPEVVIVDGYVWLGAQPGLGAHLHNMLVRRGHTCAVVGAAKTPFKGTQAVEVRRGQRKGRRGPSPRPLYVTSVGMDPTAAAQAVASMAGPWRIPLLLRRVDELTRMKLGDRARSAAVSD